MFFPGRNFLSGLICTQYLENLTLKTKKNVSTKKLGFFPALPYTAQLWIIVFGGTHEAKQIVILLF